MRKFSKKHSAMNRRENVITRLETQLSVGTKNTKQGEVPLNEGDIDRINKELKILKTRV